MLFLDHIVCVIKHLICIKIILKDFYTLDNPSITYINKLQMIFFFHGYHAQKNYFIVSLQLWSNISKSKGKK